MSCGCWRRYWQAVFFALRLRSEAELHLEQWLFLIPLMPAVGALINGVFLNKLPKSLVTALAVGSVAVSFLISLTLFISMKVGGEALHQGRVQLDEQRNDVGECGFHDGRPFRRHGAGGFRRRFPDPHLFDRLHGAMTRAMRVTSHT